MTTTDAVPEEPNSMVNRTEIARQAETTAEHVLSSVGFEVTNLNELVGNCPFADLLARRNGSRVLVQVKGTTTDDGKFGTPATGANALSRFAAELNCYAIYAFVQFSADETVTRFATSAEVAELAAAEEASYAGVNRYHVNIAMFDVTADGLDVLISPES